MSLAGRTLSHYHIVEEISRGGMGVVYRATDTRLNRDVALKVLPAELVSDRDRRERFIQEARAASALEHPNIAVIHDIGDADGISFIAMELVRGDKLSDAIARGEIAPSHAHGRALEIAAEVAEGMARAHSQGIVHRDLKPANVMLTEDGHAKVIDFGLAKLIAPLTGDTGGDTFARGAGTDPNVVLGTVSYMSPEQARGGIIDHRTDIFSFGVMLYEMLTGTLPFRGHSSIETIHAILHDPPQPLPRLGPAFGVEAVGDIERILEKCLAKDPNARYQGMKDLVVDLRAARRRMDAPSTSRAIAPARVAAAPARSRAAMAIAALTLVAAAAGGWLIWNRSSTTPVVEATGAKPSVAVLYFENNTGNAEMDWLRTGLTDMLVTDLSQSPDVEVLSTDRLVQILTDLRKQDDRVIAFDTVQEVARRAGVKSVLLGSYVKAGDAIRINLKLQDASSGRIISAERVEAQGESSIFPTMDELTRRIKAKFTPSAGTIGGGLLTKPGATLAPDAPLDRDLKDVTTSSVDAYRYYAEGIDNHQRGRPREALPLLEKAVAIDPTFALAYTKLAVIHGNGGDSNRRDEYARKALDLIARLTPRERYYIEGYYNANHSDTVSKAIAAYSKALELYPDHSASRNNLALIYLFQNQLDKSIQHYKVLQDRGFEFPGAIANLAAAYAAAGQPDKAIEAFNAYLARFPTAESAYANLGIFQANQGRFAEAKTALEKSRALSPDLAAATRGFITLGLSQDDFGLAMREAERFLKSPLPARRMTGGWFLAYADLHRGRSADALKHLETAANTQAQGSNETALIRSAMADVLLARGQPADALREAKRGVGDARGRDAQFRAWRNVALAQSQLGSADELAKSLAEVTRLLTYIEGPADKETPDFVRAVGAIRAGDAAAGLAALQRAQAFMVPGPVGVSAPVPIPQPAVEIWYWMGRAHLAAGRDAEAAAQFSKIANGLAFRPFSPIEYVRSLYDLGHIADRQGDRAKAREYYSRFLSYWKDGDLDRDHVQEATRKLQ